MSLAPVIADLKRIYGSGQLGEEVPASARLTKNDFLEWGKICSASRDSLLDKIAMFLAHGFHQDLLSFEFCDAIVNDLSGLVNFTELPELFFDVYCAFDAGEYRTKPEEDPLTDYTRPIIARIIAAENSGMTHEERRAAILMPRRR